MSIRDGISSYFASVNAQAPFLGYLGVAFWSAWILATSSLQDWLSPMAGGSSIFSEAYGQTRLVLIVTLMAVALGGRRVSQWFARPRFLFSVGVLSLAGNAALALSWSLPALPPVLFHGGAALSGFAAGILLVRAGIAYSALSPWRAMLLFMTSQLMAACLYLIVTAAPPAVALGLFCLLIPCGFAGFALIGPADGARAAAPLDGAFALSFARLVAMIFVFRFCSNYVKTLLALSQTAEMVELGVTGNILLKMFVAIVLIGYAFNANKKVDYGRLCYFLFVGTTVVLAVLPLFEDQVPLFYALNGVLSGLAGNIAFLIFAYVCFQANASPLRVYGWGYGAVLLGSLVGYGAGTHLAPPLGEGLAVAPFLAAAYGLILLELLVFPPKQFDRLMAPTATEDAIDRARMRAEGEEGAGGVRARYDRVAEAHGLTEREREVMALLASGHGRRYVADRLSLSMNTIRSHTRNIYGKLDVHSHSELMAVLEDRCDAAGNQ